MELDGFLYLYVTEILLKLRIVPGERMKLACRVLQYQDMCLRLKSYV